MANSNGNARLTPKHIADLRTSGLSDETIAACGFYTLTDINEIARVLNWQYPAKHLGDCLAIPFPDAGGKRTDFVRLKPDTPRFVKGKPAKYESPVRSSIRVFFPPGTLPHLLDTSVPLLITEGEKKAAKADQEGYPCIGLTGVDCFIKKTQRDGDGKRIGEPELADDLQDVAWLGREVCIAFDSDAAQKCGVANAEVRLAQVLRQAGARANTIRLPGLARGRSKASTTS